MSAATKTSAPAPAPAAAALTPAQTEQLARAQSYFRLEEYILAQPPAFNQRRTDEEEKLFKDLSAIPTYTGNTRLAERLKFFAAAIKAINDEEAQLKHLSRLLRARLRLLTEEQFKLLRLALEQRLKVLSETHSREQKEADAVQTEIRAVKKRLDEISGLKAPAKAAAKAH